MLVCFLIATLAVFLTLELQQTQEAFASPPSIRISPLALSEDILSAAEPEALLSISYDANDTLAGNAMPVRIDGAGSTRYRLGMISGATNAVCSIPIVDDCDGASQVAHETGNMVGFTRTALETRLNNTPDACSEFAKTFLPNYWLAPECDPFRQRYEGFSKVIVLPLVDEVCNGSCVATVTDIGVFFLERVDSCNGNHCVFSVRFAGTLLNEGGHPSCGVHLLQRLGVPPGRLCGRN